MKTYKNKPKPSGFTLIEILTVITILAVLGGIGFGTYIAVIRQTKSTQAGVMIENISSSLEARVNQGFSEEEIDTLDREYVIELPAIYPSGDGSENSSKNLYAMLSGDFDLDGKIDVNVDNVPGKNRKPMFPQIDPEYAGKGQYLIRQSEEQLKGGRDTTKLIMVDPWNHPLRYKYDPEGADQHNNVENGFDIWSLGPDGVDSGTLNEDGDDGGLDNITNW